MNGYYRVVPVRVIEKKNIKMYEWSSSSGFPHTIYSKDQIHNESFTDNLKLTYNMQHINISLWIINVRKSFNRYQLQQEYHYIVKSPIFHI